MASHRRTARRPQLEAEPPLIALAATRSALDEAAVLVGRPLPARYPACLAHRARRAPGQTYRMTRDRARDIRDRRADRAVAAGPAVFESFDVFEPQERPRSSSWVRPSGIGLG